MSDAIKNFPKQFEFEPVIVKGEKLGRYEGFIVAGMGGSHWAADLLKIWNPASDITIHSDYGFPAYIKSERTSQMLFIASSYSGNTEETLDSLEHAREKGMAVAAITVGGKLLEIAKKDSLPYVQIPDTGIQPRSALGFSMIGLLALMGKTETIQKLHSLSDTLDAGGLEKEGKALADRLNGYIPLIYSSATNKAIAYNWKIKCNETGKIPAFCNVFPELNHNEMNGFDVTPATKTLSEKFYYILLKDAGDHPQVQKRMEVLDGLYRDRRIRGESIELKGAAIFEKIFSSLILADWASFYTAENYGLESEQVPMVEEFKITLRNTNTP
ncbi:MAG: glucose/mannose-6-phosphate isomerase [Parcubacteria group bacterium Gr01-1014_33]|nr:MAG: glucose/mannose-6-phosphate isomerase [Parcubacteria group bacterium Gr01-1014_33]